MTDYVKAARLLGISRAAAYSIVCGEMAHQCGGFQQEVAACLVEIIHCSKALEYAMKLSHFPFKYLFLQWHLIHQKTRNIWHI